MMKVLVFTISLLAAGVSFAAEAKRPFVDLYILNTEGRFERGLNQQLAVHSSNYNVALGGRMGTSALLVEAALFKMTTGNATLATDLDRHEYMLWWKEHVYSFGVGDLFTTLGLGAYQEEIRTSLGGSLVVDHGELSAMAGGGIGFGTLLFRHIIVSVEGRFMAGSNFDPNPSPGILFRSGVEF